ncbi:MAG: hypothetical protein ACPGR8_10345 [Limisphaerales bacterium]
MLLPRCDTWATGPIGTLGDGCNDTAEWAFNGACVVAVFAVVGATRRLLPAIGAVLACSSLYHVVFGEGTLAEASAVAVSDGAVCGAVLALINTREITLTTQTLVAAVLVQMYGSGVEVPAVWAYLCATFTLNLSLAPFDTTATGTGLLLFYDAFGVAIGAALISSPPPKSVAIL